jgi:hypothetical protein
MVHKKYNNYFRTLIENKLFGISYNRLLIENRTQV